MNINNEIVNKTIITVWKENSSFADLTYGKEDSISPSTLNFAVAKA